MSAQSNLENLLWNQRFTMVVIHFLSGVMITSLVVPIVSILQSLVPEWQFQFLIPFCLFLALEAMFAWRKLRGYIFTEPYWITYRLAEGVILLIFLRLILYGQDGFINLIQEIPSWGETFIQSFFTIEYFCAISIGLMVWLFATRISELLWQLEGDERLLKIEEDSGVSEFRSSIRNRLGGYFIAGGGLLIILTAIMRLASEAIWAKSLIVRINFINTVFYFICGLVVLSLTQFSILRVRWILEKVPVQRDIPKYWLLYSLLIFICVGGITIFLPTTYSRELLGILQSLVSLITTFFWLIALIIITPFALLISWILSLFKGENVKPAPLLPQQLEPVIQSGNKASLAWLEQLRTIIFWVLLVGVISYSFWFYFHEHPELISWIKQLRLVKFLKSVYIWLVHYLKGARRRLSESVNSMVNKFIGEHPRDQGQDNTKTIRPRYLAPRQQIFYYYFTFLGSAKKYSLPERTNQTPHEYAQIVISSLDNQTDGERLFDGVTPDSGVKYLAQESDTSRSDIIQNISELTHGFEKARYSNHSIEPQAVNLVHYAWRNIRNWFRRL